MHPMKTFLAGIIVLFLCTQSAGANVVVRGTRVILAAHDGETTVNLFSHNTNPVLIESWTDDGDEKATPETAKAPFLVTPPMFRMEAGSEQALRVLFTGNPSALPADRESLFYFNVLEIPPKPASGASGENRLQLAMRTRLKLFYRPEGVKGDVVTAIKTLNFKATVEAGKTVLVVHNPSPYYVTLNKIALQSGGNSYKVDTGMVAPFADLRLPVAGMSARPAAGMMVSYSCINDYGGETGAKKGLL